MLRVPVLSLLILTGMLFIAPATAQTTPPSILPDNLEPITAENVSRLEELAMLGRGSIRSISLSPDGNTLAVGSTIGLWFYDANNLRQEPKLLNEEEFSVNFVTYSPNGELLAAIHRNALTFWETKTFTHIRTIYSRQGYDSFAFAPNSKTVAISESGRVGILNLETFKTEFQVQLRYDVDNLVFSPNGQMLIFSAEYDGWIWNIASKTLIVVSHSFSDWDEKTSMFIPGTSLLAFGSSGTVYLRDISSSQEVTLLRNLRAGVTGLDVSNDGRYVAAGTGFVLGYGIDDAVQVWDLQKRQSIASLGQRTRGFVAVEFDPNGKTLYLASQDSIQRWDITTQKLIDAAPMHMGWGARIVISPDGKTIAAGFGNGEIHLVSAVTGEHIGLLEGTWHVDELLFSPDGSILAASMNLPALTSLGDVWVWDVKTQELMFSVENVGYSGVIDLDMSHNGNLLAFSSCVVSSYETPCYWSRVQVWDIPNEVLKTDLKMPHEVTGPIAFSENDEFLATVDLAKTKVRLWNVETGENIATIRGFAQDIDGLVYVGEDLLGLTLPEEAENYPIELWNIEGLSEAIAISGYKERRWDAYAAFNLDGSIAVSIGNYPTFWSTAKQEKIAVLKGNADRINDVAFSADGKLMISVNSNGTIRLWGVPASSN